eukprot:359869-Chlamydomonas_euryale.AAC.12
MCDYKQWHEHLRGPGLITLGTWVDSRVGWRLRLAHLVRRSSPRPLASDQRRRRSLLQSTVSNRAEIPAAVAYPRLPSLLVHQRASLGRPRVTPQWPLRVAQSGAFSSAATGATTCRTACERGPRPRSWSPAARALSARRSGLPSTCRQVEPRKVGGSRPRANPHSSSRALHSRTPRGNPHTQPSDCVNCGLRSKRAGACRPTRDRPTRSRRDGKHLAVAVSMNQRGAGGVSAAGGATRRAGSSAQPSALRQRFFGGLFGGSSRSPSPMAAQFRGGGDLQSISATQASAAAHGAPSSRVAAAAGGGGGQQDADTGRGASTAVATLVRQHNGGSGEDGGNEGGSAGVEAGAGQDRWSTIQEPMRFDIDLGYRRDIRAEYDVDGDQIGKGGNGARRRYHRSPPRVPALLKGIYVLDTQPHVR